MIRPRLVARLALRNVVGQARRSLLLSALLAVVATLAVVGGALVENIERGMRRTIVESLAGERQVVPESSVGQLSLFGDVYFGDVTLERIPDAPSLAARLRELDAVEQAVPMALRLAVFTQPSTIDAAIERLRRALQAGDAQEASAAERHLRWAAARLASQLEGLSPEALPPGELERRRGVVARVLSEELWQRVGTDLGQTLMFLDASFAPLFGDSTPLFLHVTGVDVDAFAAAFPRFRVVQGRLVGSAEPAFMVSESTFDAVRHQYLSKLEELAERAAGMEGALPPARLAALREAAVPLVEQLTPDEAEQLRERLCARVECPATATAVEALERYAQVDGGTVAERWRYLDEVAMAGLPRGLLVVGRRYTLAMADEAGRLKSALVELVGTYRFAGLDDVPIEVAALTNAATFARVDDPRRRKRTDRTISDEPAFDADALDALFLSDEAPAVQAPTTGSFDELEGFAAASRAPPPFDLARWSGQSIALRLAEGATPGALEEVRAIVSRASNGTLAVVDGFAVSGPVGHAVPILKGVFVGVLVLLLLLAFGVVANALVLSWLRRIPELGTLRALGATRADVWATLLVEATLLGLVGAGAGAAVGATALAALGASGIPAPSAIFEFIFGGPRLFPIVDAGALLLAGSVVWLALLASLYPAWRAAHATPREAMEALR